LHINVERLYKRYSKNPTVERYTTVSACKILKDEVKVIINDIFISV